MEEDRWRAGADIVYGVRTHRVGETAFKLWTAKLFYRLIRALGADYIRQEPDHAADKAVFFTHLFQGF
jgi:hypothetical protein